MLVMEIINKILLNFTLNYGNWLLKEIQYDINLYTNDVILNDIF